MVSRSLLALLLGATPCVAKEAFVFLGATGDNALRDAGVWAGLYEAFAGGVYNADTVGIHVAMNTPHTVDELHTKVIATLTPLHTELQKIKGWKCQAKGGDCTPEALLKDVVVNIWQTRSADEQAANMTASLADATKVTMYLSVPPFVFASWSEAAVKNWGKDRMHVAAEKPFGTSLANADSLYNGILGAGLAADHIHLVDHWLSFFMDKNLPTFRKIVETSLGIEFSSRDISQIVVTEFETRGLDGRGGFFDGVGQVRDMIQSHLLQVLALTLMDANAVSRSGDKLRIFNATSTGACHFGQYDGFLSEPKLTYHPTFADSTLTSMQFHVDTEEWKDTVMTIQTGKAMGATLYTIELFQRNGPGVITYNNGKEEQGTGSITVKSWPIKDSSEFDVPAPGFTDDKTLRMKPSATADGDGYILQYVDPNLYFPKPYAIMAANLLTGKYEQSFVTYPECHRSWEIVNASSGKCLDPSPADVKIYKPPTACGNTPPAVCYNKAPEATVDDLYNKKFVCSAANDKIYGSVDFYKAKCKKKADKPLMI